MTESTYHILVVDDDDILRAGVCDLLDLAGYSISSAVDGQDAIEVLERMPRPPALIVSDIRMPRMDGYDFLKEVRRRPEWVSVPFIFLSAKGEPEHIRLGKLQGADDYIPKPFEFEDLLVAVKASLSRYAAINAIQEQRLQQLKIQILDVINHEFRTPLTFIVAYADLIANNPAFQHQDDLRQYINGILTGSDRLSRLIFNFLTLAELESGIGEKVYERRKALVPDLGSVLGGIVDKHREKARTQGIVLEFRSDVNPVPAVVCDAEYLEMAVNHLIDNAVKFTPYGTGDKVEIVLSKDESSLAIAITDHGPGISPEQQESLFDIFYQIDRSKTEQPGTGSGLPIVRHIADLHGGQVRLTSVVGEGSTFRLLIPLPGE
nr:response regulator [Anaerolineae bacterium]